MTRWVVIPARSAETGKTRLSPVLDADSRARLVSAMAGRAVTAARQARGFDRVCLVGPTAHGIDDLPLIDDPGGGLNAALGSAVSAAMSEGVSRLVLLAGDLPLVEPHDIELLGAAAAGTVAIAPDRHNLGTNALSLPLPEAAAFRFAFGADSCANHYAEAERLGLRPEIVRSDGLARDIDTPDDLDDAADIIAGLDLGVSR